MTEQSGEDTMLPCSGCGTDLFYRDCEETTEIVDAGTGRTFQGESMGREVPALICPDCGEVTSL